jgi:hypothetical protein
MHGVFSATKRCVRVKRSQFRLFKENSPKTNFKYKIRYKTTPVVHLELRIFPRIKKKLKMALMGYSGAWEKRIHVKF